jgi:N utilization substance protein A
LFELEVPEIGEGIVEIKAVAREPGHRSKVAVMSNEPGVDPVGACVGAKGSRVRMVVNELRGEKIDVVQWTEDPARFVASALAPAKVKEVRVDPVAGVAQVVVPDYQLSLAIGKEGQNARLAAKLTGLRVDIRSESQAGDEERGRQVATRAADDAAAAAVPDAEPDATGPEAEPEAPAAPPVVEREAEGGIELPEAEEPTAEEPTAEEPTAEEPTVQETLETEQAPAAAPSRSV